MVSAMAIALQRHESCCLDVNHQSPQPSICPRNGSDSLNPSQAIIRSFILNTPQSPRLQETDYNDWHRLSVIALNTGIFNRRQVQGTHSVRVRVYHYWDQK
jgi:hypothetical protein